MKLSFSDELHARDDGTLYFIHSYTGEEVDVSLEEVEEAMSRYEKFRRIEKEYISYRIADTIHHFRHIPWKAKKAQFGFIFSVIFWICVLLEDIFKKSTILASIITIVLFFNAGDDFLTNWAQKEELKVLVLLCVAGLAIFILNKLMIKWMDRKVGLFYAIWTCGNCDESGIDLEDNNVYQLCRYCNGTGLIVDMERRDDGLVEVLEQRGEENLELMILD